MATTAAEKQDFSQRLKATPTKPGVYIMRNANGDILYVGKAASLRHRLRSYFAAGARHERKVRNMMARVFDFEFVLTESESEALILECNLIKEHKPPYNVRLKDDKSYPFIKIDTTEAFPQVYITRKVTDDGAKYFGPFASAYSVRRTLALLKKLFPYRSCTKVITGNDPRPCLDFYIHRCIGPCIGAVDQNQYAEVIDQVVLFLEGKTAAVARDIAKRMRQAAEALEFERASILRDQYRAIEKVNEGQKVLHLTSENADVIAMAPASTEAWVEVFFVRQGKVVGRDNFIMAGTEDNTPGGILSAFVEQFYNASPYVPPRILLQHPLNDVEAIGPWLEQKRQGKVKLYVPQRGEKRKLVEMVAENAVEGLEQLRVRQDERGDMEAAVSELQEALNLPKPPQRIECYDISNIQGTNSVGSMVVLEDGKPKTSHYRRFKVKSVEGIDDYSMMREVLTRRFKRIAKENETSSEGGGTASEDTWQIVPDLVLIDGGKGHLGAALQVLLELGVEWIPLASLAKENEELFVPQTPEPIVLPRTSQALFLVQRARDEAHRFAITYHRQRRSKSAVVSAMNGVPGIGPKRRGLLLRKFGSARGVREASVEELAAVPGMTVKLATRLKEYL
ncbi:MAG: excinuclease ABC subunit UvrC [SAR202 cluster bacterium]|nr:excinuclease ABC subunit UvrC [SAR202 cluster bacterium]